MDTIEDALGGIENPAATLKKELDRVQPLSTELSTRFCIYRVPDRLRRSNEKFYTPRLVSIGPLHHGREEFKSMEEYKIKLLQYFLGRTRVCLEDFVEVIKKDEAKLRNCYAETIRLNSHDFVKMILLDAAFIFEVLLRPLYPALMDDRIYQNPRLILDLLPDLVLLENQLPFFILEELLTKANIHISTDSPVHERSSMIDLTREFFSFYFTFNRNENSDETYYSEVGHFVDFLRIRDLPSHSQDRDSRSLSAKHILASVTELRQAGVKLGSSKKLFDISFDNGILEIPLLRVNKLTELTLRNLTVFEQCHCTETFINDYIVFMNFLLNSSKDVDLLVQNGIIKNELRDSEGVSIIFHNLVEDTAHSGKGFYFSSLVEDLNNHCRAPRHKWMATLKQDYLNTPWASISVIAAVLLILLTIVQAVCSILQVIYM